MKPVAILASGMVTGVGLTAAASCAAIRCAIDNFADTPFTDRGGESIVGSQVPLERPWRGVSKLVRMAVPAIAECLDQARGISPERIPLLLCVAEPDRPGRLKGVDDLLFKEIAGQLGISFHPSSAVIPRGRVGGARAIEQASDLIHGQKVPFCIVAGVDSLLVAGTLAAYERRSRLLTSQNSNGFIPGEAAAAVLVGSPDPTDRRELTFLGIGSGREHATIASSEPLRGEGLLQAFRAAFAEAGCEVGDFDYRIADCNGEQYGFKEAALALDRILRNRKDLFEIWHPADCLGEIGAAIGPCILGVALQAVRKGYAFGRGPLCHFSGEDGERVALVLNSGELKSN